jgi:hypothetical protein
VQRPVLAFAEGIPERLLVVAEEEDLWGEGVRVRDWVALQVGPAVQLADVGSYLKNLALLASCMGTRERF